MRDPRDVLKGRIDAKINRKMFDARVAGRRALDSAVTGAAKKATKKKTDAPPARAEGGQKKKRMGWWPFGGKDDEAEGNACPGCGAEVDASWSTCPYCGSGLAAPEAPAAAGPGQPPIPGGPPGSGGGGPPPMIAVNKTMAVNIEALAAPRRQVVGWLVVMSGAQRGMDFRLVEGKNSLGAAADNDIVVTDEYLSSKHASIRYEDGKYEFIDHDSTNGSYVNDKKVSKEELIDNDSIRLGRTELRFKALY